MRNYARVSSKRQSNCFLISTTTLLLAYFLYTEAVVGLPLDNSENTWPSFPRRNIAALARDGYVKGSTLGFKRSISTLAKNGQLPTFRSPYDETDKQEQDDDGSHDKRNLASIARLRSFSAMKRNIQALARDGFRLGRGQYNPPNDKRNIQALARNGLIHKKDEVVGDEYFYPFYQNSVPPLSEMDGPIDFNEIYDYQQSVNPDMLPPLSQVFKRSDGAFPQAFEHHNIDFNGLNSNWYLKRGSVGLPAHGLYRPIYIGTSANRNRRSIYSIPDEIESNDIAPEDYENENQDKRSVDEDDDNYDNDDDDDDVARQIFEKRHIGSLARLGLLPSFRFSGGRYSRSGRARLLLPSQELYRKHSPDENFGIREYLSDSEVGASDSDDTDLPSPPILAHSHPTGRYFHRPLNNELPNAPQKNTPLPQSPLSPNYAEFTKNRWQKNPNFYYFRSLKVPYHSSGKRYLLRPAVDNVLLKKVHRNSSLPSRRKNQ